MYRYFVLSISVIFITTSSGCLSSRDDVILTRNGLSDYYTEIFTEFRKAKGKNREKYKQAISRFFYQFRITDLQKDYKKNPCILTKEAVLKLMGKPDRIDASDPNHYIYVISRQGENSQFHIVLAFKDGIFDEIFSGASKR